MKCKFILILLNIFVWNYGLFGNAQALLGMLSMVFHFQIHMHTIAPMTSEIETFFMDDYSFCKSSLLFFHSVLVLPYYCLEIILKVLRSKYAKKIRFNIEQVCFSSKFFKHIKNFTLTLFQNTIS